jgi:hypothetical protein
MEKTEDEFIPEHDIEHMLDVGCKSLSKFKGLLSGEIGLQAMVSATLWWTKRSLDEALIRNSKSAPNEELATLSRDIKLLNLATCTQWQQILRRESEEIPTDDVSTFDWTAFDLECL